MLTVACVWVTGNVPFTADYVTRLQSMARRHLDRPFRFVCLTDRPEALPKIDTVRIKAPAPCMGWWAKVQLFNRAHGLGGRVLYLDLDTLIVDRLDPVVDFPSRFALVPHAGTFNGRHGLRVVKRYNSSVMVWDAGVADRLFDEWSPSVAFSLWGDQDWIGEQMPDAETMPLQWFPRLSELEGPPFGAAKVILAKKPKNDDAAKRWPWFAERWQ